MCFRVCYSRSVVYFLEKQVAYQKQRKKLVVTMNLYSHEPEDRWAVAMKRWKQAA